MGPVANGLVKWLSFLHRDHHVLASTERFPDSKGQKISVNEKAETVPMHRTRNLCLVQIPRGGKSMLWEPEVGLAEQKSRLVKSQRTLPTLAVAQMLTFSP